MISKSEVLCPILQMEEFFKYDRTKYKFKVPLLYKVLLIFFTLEGLIRSIHRSSPYFYEAACMRLVGNKILMLQTIGASVYDMTLFHNTH